MKLALNWQLSKIYIYTFLSGFQSLLKRKICRQESWLKSEIMKVGDDKKGIFNLYFSTILKGATSQQMCYILASRPLFLFRLCIEITTVARFSVISSGHELVSICTAHTSVLDINI